MRLVLRWLAIFSRVDQYSNRLNASDDQRLEVEPAARARLASVDEADSAQNVYRATALGFHELERDDDFSDYPELTGREVKR